MRFVPTYKKVEPPRWDVTSKTFCEGKRSSGCSVEAADGRMVVVREPEHRPQGDPCALCGLPAGRHRQRPGHKPQGDPCEKCGLPAKKHRPRDHVRIGQESKERRKVRERRYRAERKELEDSAPIVAIDGEGRDLPCDDCGEIVMGKDPETKRMHLCRVTGKRCRRPHVYTYLSASEEETKRGSVEATQRDGLSTRECLDFLLSIEAKRVFGFSLGYDLTMMLRDLPDDKFYKLLRPNRRQRRLPSGLIVHKPVYWQGYKLAYLQRRLQVTRVSWDKVRGKYKTIGDSVVVWDVFAFYQAKFTRALKNWKTCEQAVIDEIEHMKEQRGEFAKMTASQVKDYCDHECRLLAKLVRQLIETHETTDPPLPLKNFYGAGSTASALLTHMRIKEYVAQPPEEMRDAVARGFFGGRFESSRLGAVNQRCWAHDISSAYPYQLTRMPCLVHGTWRLVTGEREADRAARTARLALLKVEVRRSGPTCWGPLPFRTPDKTIVFPRSCGHTWVWRDEYVAAKDTLWPGVRAKEAWVYETPCDCAPFAELPLIYKRRIKIGKEGAGIVMKLGPNSVYGKLAQSVGSAVFQSWVLAGCVTSNTRAQLLTAIAAAKDPASVLMLATDGVFATEKLALPQPEDTGTWECEDENGKAVRKPLGGWEVKDPVRGMFLARPGIYWPLRPTKKQLEEVKARGISRKILLEHAADIEKHFDEVGWQEDFRVEGCVRFVGARQGIRKGKGDEIVRSESYGRWVDYPIDVSFDPHPKRAEVRPDMSLSCWERWPGDSMPYKKAEAEKSREARRIRRYQRILLDQPDGDLSVE